jgi:hypothetical protein
MEQPRLSESSDKPTSLDEVLQFRLNRLDTEIRTAFDVLNQRITWLMISNSFLFSAFISLDKSADIARYLRWLLPGLGVISALLVGIAAVGKHRIIKEVKRLRINAEKQASQFGCEQLEGKTWPHRIINLPSQVLPWLLLLLWLLILRVQL